MRKHFLKAGITSFAVAAIASMTLIGTQTTARAATITGCYAYTCYIHEDMGSGYCEADDVLTSGGSFTYGLFQNVDTGYTCAFWVERNVNATGWYRVSPVYDFAPFGGSYETPNYWNGAGYQSRVCLQFIWSSTSSGAVHCSPSWNG